MVAQHLSEKLGQPFVIENRPGAGGNLAAQAVVNAAPDGYTVLAIAHVHAINATLYKQLPYNFIRDIIPVAGLVQMPNVLEVHPSVPAKTVPEFIAWLKANEGKISYASAGSGTSAHLATELFKAMTGTTMQHIPYRGSGPALIDMLSGQVTVIFDTLSSSIEHIRAGKLKAIAVTSAKRIDALPDVPVHCGDRAGLRGNRLVRRRGAERHAARDRRQTQPRDQRRAGTTPRSRRGSPNCGAVPFVATPAEMVTFVAEETERWGKAVKFSGATVD